MVVMSDGTPSRGLSDEEAKKYWSSVLFSQDSTEEQKKTAIRVIFKLERKSPLERIIAMQARIVVTKEQKKDFENFLKANDIHKSPNQRRIRIVYDKLYYNIFSVDNEFTYTGAIPKYSLTCLANDVEGFENYMKIVKNIMRPNLRKLLRAKRYIKIKHLQNHWKELEEILKEENVNLINDFREVGRVCMSISGNAFNSYSAWYVYEKYEEFDNITGTEYDLETDSLIEESIEIEEEEVTKKKETVIEKTWNQIIAERIPCYFWNGSFIMQNVYLGWLDTVFENQTQKFKGSGMSFSYTAPTMYCKPIDPRIVIVEEKKPVMKYRPFKNFEEVMEAIKVHGQWIQNKNKDYYYLFIHHLNFQNNSVQMMELFKGYKFLDDSPFGVLEEVK